MNEARKPPATVAQAFEEWSKGAMVPPLVRKAFRAGWLARGGELGAVAPPGRKPSGKPRTKSAAKARPSGPAGQGSNQGRILACLLARKGEWVDVSELCGLVRTTSANVASHVGSYVAKLRRLHGHAIDAQDGKVRLRHEAGR